MAKATKDDMELKIDIIRTGLKNGKSLEQIQKDIEECGLLIGEIVNFMKRGDIMPYFKDIHFRRRAWKKYGKDGKKP